MGTVSRFSSTLRMGLVFAGSAVGRNAKEELDSFTVEGLMAVVLFASLNSVPVERGVTVSALSLSSRVLLCDSANFATVKSVGSLLSKISVTG